MLILSFIVTYSFNIFQLQLFCHECGSNIYHECYIILALNMTSSTDILRLVRMLPDTMYSSNIIIFLKYTKYCFKDYFCFYDNIAFMVVFFV